MSQINPLSGVVVNSTQVQQRQATEKDRQIRRLQNLTKNSALQGDQLEHQVESAEEVTPAHEHDDQAPPKRRRPAPKGKQEAEDQQDDDKPRLDLTA